MFIQIVGLEGIKNLQFNPYQFGVGWGGVGRGGFKKFKPIPAPSCSARLKSCSIPAPLPLWGEKNPCGEGQVKWDGTKLPSLLLRAKFGGRFEFHIKS